MEAIGDPSQEHGGPSAALGNVVLVPFSSAMEYDGGSHYQREPRLPSGPTLESVATGAETYLARLAELSALFANIPDGDAHSPREITACSDPAEPADLAGAAALVTAAALTAPDHLALADYVEAAEFAAQVEELSRTVDYLQILAAGAVDRTRTAAISNAATRSLTSSPANSPADDGCRNTAEFLRIRLRIGITEARRRLHLAHNTQPATTITGDTTPPAREHLATALTPTPADTPVDPDNQDESPDTTPAESSASAAAPLVSSRAATIITTVLERLRHHTTVENLDQIEEHLTHTAATADPDFLARVARRCADTIDADGTEPTEEALRHTQGAFIRKPRHGLHHLEIFATTEQFEHLQTVMNVATNPRTHTPPTGTNSATDLAQVQALADKAGQDDVGPAGTDQDSVWQENTVDLDRRTRSQKQLDGIISAVQAALSTNTLPTTGGNRPQILATINHQDLLPAPAPQTGIGNGNTVNNRAGSTIRDETSNRTGTGNFAFNGPVAAATLRKLACDADIIPAVLGTHGEILDLGRKTRLFTTAQRLALTARDQGCAFPNCTIPAPWCEAHHITYWSHQGPTNTNNGVLLCSHHHHLIHKEQWTINIHHNTPWFTPPRHIDPTQKPQQNHYFKPPPPPHRRE
ncbi:DUF222 domain-containing protein [Pseudarthrobacter sp. J75]|uniref:HNH endonuclease signature motif containing protein n=1 Tax=unclassified Pseudarthrobacter TaxID=2647000 RepID=UPI002E82378A|nr:MULTISPECIES: DUF222 domain-containing protein [unclassified Pseudarthrobacter]MEE2521902.1 DUF222 domain-containing protein [Pseudarthrobacter sp. J47]MEE2528827.1 DUF222 domain-containing protein [Pseudarthrobacter sp. J75]MEE2569976.1 DUF222 domain-containing protein [Pseudarthrobacter sp. J64]